MKDYKQSNLLLPDCLLKSSNENRSTHLIFANHGQLTLAFLQWGIPQCLRELQGETEIIKHFFLLTSFFTNILKVSQT